MPTRGLAVLTAVLTLTTALVAGCGGEYQYARKISGRNVDRIPLAESGEGPAARLTDERLRGHFLLYGPMPRALAVTADGATYVAWPRVRQPLDVAVGLLRDDGTIQKIPNLRWNQFNPAVPQQRDPRVHWVSPVALTVDERDRLWVLDDGRINETRPVKGGPKLVCWDLGENRVVNNIPLGQAVGRFSRLSDVVVELSHGREGMAYVADAALGERAGIVVVDLATGDAWRKLDGHASVVGERGFRFSVESELVYPAARGRVRGRDIPTDAPGVGVESLALSPDGRTLYFTPLSGETLYRVPSEYLRERPDPATTRPMAEAQVVDEDAPVEAMGGPGALGFANESMAVDSQGRVYLADVENNAVRQLTPGRNEAGSRLSLDRVLQDRRLIWPTSLSISRGALYVLSAQENRRPALNEGGDEREPPYAIFRAPISGESVRSAR